MLRSKSILYCLVRARTLRPHYQQCFRTKFVAKKYHNVKMATSAKFIAAMRNRRTIYSISPESPISDEKIKDIIDQIILHTPSPFNVQSARAVILFGKDHEKLWDIVREIYKAAVPPPVYNFLDGKITGYRQGYGTVLWYEDPTAFDELAKKLGERWAGVKGKCPQWSEHSSGMHQFAAWTALEAEGFGCNLQHYNPLIDERLSKEWNIPGDWSLKAQLVFGTPTGPPVEKTFKPLEDRVFVHKS